ncbi:MAG: helix-turn-helix domain-containing protein [Prevotella sp.]|nr:helix-turn-helix domain-containing protein [Prevotella sp.]
MTDLRVSEAKRILKEHPDWSNETVAIHCGFNDRSYFQTIFKKSTGMTPAEFIQTTH